jgi:hypothetical protein
MQYLISKSGLSNEELEELVNPLYQSHYVKSLTFHPDSETWTVCLIMYSELFTKTARKLREGEKKETEPKLQNGPFG